MNPLLDCLDQLPAGMVGTVVHVGAGAGDEIERYATLAPSKVLLVEGDPEVLPDLRQRAAGFPWAQVLDTPVTPQGGTLRWHRFNLRMLNGPLQPEGLARLYPRLRELDGVQIVTRRLADVLNHLLAGTTDERGTLLVLDVPGQEDGLLASLGAELLEGFDWVLVRGCSIGGGTGWATANAAVKRLREAGYAVTATPAPSAQGLWPVTLLNLDRKVMELARLREEHAKVAGERQALIDTLHQAKAAAEKAAADRATQVQELTQARDEQARLASERQNQIEALNQAKAAVDKAASDRAVQVEKLTLERQALTGELEQAAQQQHAQAADLEQAKAAHAELEAKSNWRGEQMTVLRREQDEQSQLLQAAEAERDQLKTAAAALHARVEAAHAETEAARAEVKLAEQENLRRVAELDNEVGQLRLRQRLLDEEMIKAEGQIELIKDVLLRESSL